MTRIIKVEPHGKDWRVRSNQMDEMMFHSGAAAEAAARLIADACVKAGQDAELRIYLRDGSLAGKLAYPAPATSERARAAPSAPTLQAV